MINTDDFVKRLELIFEFYGESASSFADKIGVQRSSLSHLLSGRNKPSLDFILKLLDVFPEVDLYWITNGKGVFPKGSKTEEVKSPTSQFKNQSLDLKIETEMPKEHLEFKKLIETQKNPSGKKTEKIVVFYTDGTFKEYLSE